MNSRSLIIFSVFLTGLSIIGFVCNNVVLNNTVAKAKKNIISVKQDKLTNYLIVYGEFHPIRATRISVPRFRERGSVPIQAMALEGSLVRPGDLLLQIDNAKLNDNLNSEQINLEKAENDLIRKQAEAETEIKDLEMELVLRKLDVDKAALKAEISRELVPLREWQDYQFNFQKAKKEYDKIALNLKLTKQAVEQESALLRIKRDQILAKITGIKADLNALRIVADREGTVLYENAPPTWNSNDPPRKFQLGDQVYPGMTILSVPDLSEMEAQIFISEVDGGLVRPGMRVRLVPDSNPNVEFFGTIDYVPAVAERIRQLSNVRIFIGRAKLDHTDMNFMKPGTSVQAEILLEERVGLILPRRTVFEENGTYYVHHTERGKIPIKLLSRNTTACLIEGLQEGDTVEIDN
ncbi:MAG: hypothetical protein AB1489_42210 [Acidobacteriota bacterium]